MTTRYRARCTEHQWEAPARETPEAAGEDMDRHYDEEHGE